MKRLIVVAFVSALAGCGGRLTLFITSMPGTVTAPSPVSVTFSFVSGVVTDSSSHRGLPGCTVTWTAPGDASGDRGQVVTDGNGTYRVEVSGFDGSSGATGRIAVRASKAGYVSQTRDVTLPERTSVDFSLTADD